jgi:hypothetical protein
VETIEEINERRGRQGGLTGQTFKELLLNLPWDPYGVQVDWKKVCEEQDEWEDMTEDLEWGIRDRFSDDGGEIGWWMERWRKDKCQGSPPLFFVVGEWCEVKWLSPGFWDLVINEGVEILVNGWGRYELDEYNSEEDGDCSGGLRVGAEPFYPRDQLEYNNMYDKDKGFERRGQGYTQEEEELLMSLVEEARLARKEAKKERKDADKKNMKLEVAMMAAEDGSSKMREDEEKRIDRIRNIEDRLNRLNIGREGNNGMIRGKEKNKKIEDMTIESKEKKASQERKLEAMKCEINTRKDNRNGNDLEKAGIEKRNREWTERI